MDGYFHCVDHIYVRSQRRGRPAPELQEWRRQGVRRPQRVPVLPANQVRGPKRGRGGA